MTTPVMAAWINSISSLLCGVIYFWSEWDRKKREKARREVLDFIEEQRQRQDALIESMKAKATEQRRIVTGTTAQTLWTDQELRDAVNRCNTFYP